MNSPIGATEPLSSSASRIRELDGLRGVACLMVVAHHYVIGVATTPPGSLLNTIQFAVQPLVLGGVDLFFVLSGFLIGGILFDHRGSPRYFSTFYIRRGARILPVYGVLLVTFLIAAVLGLGIGRPWAVEWLMKPPLPAWSYATFTQNIAMAFRNDPGPFWIGVTWSLAIEEQFYLILPLVVAIVSRDVVRYIAIGCILISPVIRLFAALHWNWWAAYALTPCRMENLMLGLVVAIIVRDPVALVRWRGRRRRVDAASVVILVLLTTHALPNLSASFNNVAPAVAVFLGWSTYTLLSMLYALLLLRIFLVDGGTSRILRSSLLTAFGAISYGLYMYHQAVNGLFHGFILGQTPRLETAQDGWVTAAAAVVAVGLSWISYVVMERPIRRLGHRAQY